MMCLEQSRMKQSVMHSNITYQLGNRMYKLSFLSCPMLLARGALGVILLCARTLKRSGDWIRVSLRGSFVDHGLLPLVARYISRETGCRVAVHCGGFQCEAGCGAQVETWLSEQQGHPLTVLVRECLHIAAGEMLLACDERGVPSATRTCGVCIRGVVTHFSHRPNPVALASSFGLSTKGCMGVKSRHPDLDALVAVLNACNGRSPRKTKVVCAQAILGAMQPVLQSRHIIYEPAYIGLAERLNVENSLSHAVRCH